LNPFKEELIHHDSPFPVDIFIRDNTKDIITADPHWHDCCEILYMLEGAAEQLINDKYFNARKDDLIILNKGDIHGTWCTPGENVQILVIKFLPEIISSSTARIFESKYIFSFLNNRGEKIYHLSETSKNSSNIYKLMMGLYEEFTSKDTGFEIYIKGYIFQLIASLVRSGILNTNYAFDNKGLEKLDSLFLFIEKNYNRDINLQKAADILNLSYSYFSRVFKDITGRTFKEYVDYVRICEAEKLILSGNMNISQAAYEAGFCNVSSFNRVFKRVRGYQPGCIKRSKTAKK
jgi:AraC-like DNA-binding protein